MHPPRPRLLSAESAFFLLFLLPAAAGFGYEYVLLESSANRPPVIEGNRALLQKRFTPASTFKIVLAAAALEEGVIRADTRFPCSDSHIRCCPRALDLHQALVFSSNDYFKQVIGLLGEKKIKAYADRWSFFPKPMPDSWLKQGLSSAIWAGTMRISPEDQHRFMIRLVRGELALKPAVREALLDSLTWPSPDPTRQLYGKTGSMRNVVWFNGFSRQGTETTVVTVCFQGPVSLRTRAIALFYSRFGLSWDEKLLASLGKK